MLVDRRALCLCGRGLPRFNSQTAHACSRQSARTRSLLLSFEHEILRIIYTSMCSFIFFSLVWRVQVMLTADQHYTMSSKPPRVRWAKQVEPATVDAKGSPSGERWGLACDCRRACLMVQVAVAAGIRHESLKVLLNRSILPTTLPVTDRESFSAAL